MHATNPLAIAVLFLLAAVVAVPLFRKIRLGAILGYLVAGTVLGPFGFSVISDGDAILHFAEIGVVLLLFIIGLELDPEKLWSMRRHIAGLGLGQLLGCAALLALMTYLFLQHLPAAVVIGLALGLSSTAFAIQLMAEKGIMARPEGRRGFAILLLQDLAVIPILFLVSTLATTQTGEAVAWYWSVGALLALLLIGRFVLLPALALVSRYGNHETMTAASLLIVVGAAYLMYASGLSMGMGAFIAGILLANSSFKHQLESDIEPFKGITLGLFFMAIGMTLDLKLLLQNPLVLVGLALALMALKTLLIAALLHLYSIDWKQSLKVGLMLSQGGEFAFVVMAQAAAGGIVSPEVADQINLIVGLSMALTSPLIGLLDMLLKPSAGKAADSESPAFDQPPEVVILGFGRFGQTTGRLLAANNIPFVAIDKDAEHISFVKQFGNKVYFGDATRLDLLESSGIESAKVVLVAIDNAEQADEIVHLIKHQYPRIKVVARARNRSAYWSLKAAGADAIIRELFKGSLEAASYTLSGLGFSSIEALTKIERFELHDTQMINQTYEHRDNLEKLIEAGRESREDLERIFKQDAS